MEFSSSNTIWVLLGAALVFFMQPGFAMVEAGFTRAKNAGNIIMKNFIDFAIGSVVFWLVGFGIMFGEGNGFFGAIDLALKGGVLEYASPDGVTPFAFLIFQTVFCATAATIVSGAMAERTKFAAYVIYSIVISLIIYPVSGHWIWSSTGWLGAGLGFHDFAGSTCVHMVGGIAALVGAKVLGARIGKYGKDGKPRAILGHSITLGALGVFILWFGWFGFNGASTVAADSDDALLSMGSIFVTTNLAAASGVIAVMILTWIMYKKPDVSLTLNGALAGLVGITAGCDVVSPIGSALIGAISGLVLVCGITFIDKVLKIDDPVGAIGVHGVCGALGTLLVGLFDTEAGLFYGGGIHQLLIQLLGVVVVGAWVAVTMTITFQIIKHTVGIRVAKEEEIEGLDISEHGLLSAYADFMPAVQVGDASGLQPLVSAGSAGGGKSSAPVHTPEAAVPVVDARETAAASVPAPTAAAPGKEHKFTKVSIITRPSSFEALDAALHEIGITGMTVTNLLGYGMQKGNKEYYRGIEVQPHLLPKIRAEVVVCKVPIETVIQAARNALYTGQLGDGKIFIYDVENVIKIRTGEEGYDALQDD
ncbi:MAG: ammonium transporter [Clostridiales Family XIII bacterium]|jgi:Amt family ammonium transporter|nr:ammonium transporter [Clostridiales Family XIII bacterium]